jgi:hypothetical protein
VEMNYSIRERAATGPYFASTEVDLSMCHSAPAFSPTEFLRRLRSAETLISLPARLFAERHRTFLIRSIGRNRRPTAVHDPGTRANSRRVPGAPLRSRVGASSFLEIS